MLKLFIADYCAASFAGYKVNESFNKVITEIMMAESGDGVCRVFQSDVKLTPIQAAYLNAAYAHGADMDDGNKKSMGHIAAHTMSAVFALAETMNAAWKDVFEALIVGYEVFNRIAGSAQPGIVKNGFHSTGVTGPIASAAACAKLMKLDAEGIYHAMAVAAIQASGLMIITESGQECKAFSAANSARTGILSAMMASKSINGPKYPMDSVKGWFHAFSGTNTYDEASILDGLGTKYTISESYLKPYPSCRHTHYGIECAKKIRREMADNGKALADIEAIKLYIYPTAVSVSGSVEVPKSKDEAKFSLKYALATALITGDFGLDALDVDVVDEETIDLIKKIEVITDDSLENTLTGTRSCILELYMSHNIVYSQTVSTPKGDPDNRFTWDDAYNKLVNCSQGSISSEKAKEILHTIRSINEEEKYQPIW